MPIREFRCPEGHVTERILLGVEDGQVANVDCTTCGHDARRVEISRTGYPQFVIGCGGFHAPNAS